MKPLPRVVNMETTTGIEFWIDRLPMSRGRPRSAPGQRPYTEPRELAWIEDAREAAREAIGLLGAPTGKFWSVSVHAFWPARIPAEAGQPCDAVNDVDNVVKIVLDALQGVFFENDRFVCHTQAMKAHAPAGSFPGVFVRVAPVTGFEVR